MKPVALAIFGITLVLIKSVAMRVFHIELLHPDLGVVMAVFAAFHLRPLSGSIVVLVVGLFADSLGGTPLGMKASIDLLVFFIVRFSLRILLPDRTVTQIIMLFVASIISSLLLLVALTEIEPRVTVPVIHWMLLLAVLNTMVAIPIWAVSRLISGPPIVRSAYSRRY